MVHIIAFDIGQVKQLEENIERTTEAWEGPTEVEVELESRLSQLTDLLIQKQAQVCVQNGMDCYSCDSSAGSKFFMVTFELNHIYTQKVYIIYSYFLIS
jgi:hypothetical protein